ncbi:hypothetical protein ACS0PU_005976 [Formica fusca]
MVLRGTPKGIDRGLPLSWIIIWIRLLSHSGEFHPKETSTRVFRNRSCSEMAHVKSRRANKPLKIGEQVRARAARKMFIP